MKEKKEQKKQCVWPGCEEQNTLGVPVPVVEKTKEGFKPVIKDNKQQLAQINLCPYHMAIASVGLISMVKEGEQYQLLAPTDYVKLIEATVTGLVMSGLFDEIQSKYLTLKREKIEQMRKEILKDK